MIIFRYLAKEILKTMLAATLIVLVILVTDQSVHFLQSAASGVIPASDLLSLILLQAPLLLGYLLPLGLYLAILLTLGRMFLDSEMTVLSACGVSRLKITRMVFLVAFFVAMIVMWLMAIVVPRAQGDMNDIYSAAAMRASVSKIIPGQFVNIGSTNDRVIFYAEKVLKDHTELQHVFLAKKEKDESDAGQEKWNIVVAKSAYEKTFPNQQAPYLILNQGYQYIGVPGEKKYRVLQFEQYGVRLATSGVVVSNAEQYYTMDQLWEKRRTSLAVASELQWRLSMPISVLTFALLAVPLSEVRPRTGKFGQLFPAMLIYIGYANFILLARGWIEEGALSPDWGMWWVHGVTLLLALLLTIYRVGNLRLQQLFRFRIFA